MSAASSATSPPPGPNRAFEAWARVRQASPEDPLSPTSVAKYRTIWDRWIAHLAMGDVAWSQARAGDIDAFLKDLRRRSDSARPASPVSRRRYWRILMEVYAHAVQSGWLTHNPALDAASVPPSERMSAIVLPPALLQRARGLIGQVCANDTWRDVRDRALLAVLLDVGLATGELVTLRADQILAIRGRPAALLRVEGPRKPQCRDLALSPWAQAMLQAWMKARATLAPSVPVCFCSQRTPHTLKPWAVFHLAARLAGALEQATGVTLGHKGPGLFRTAVIAGWLHDGIAPEEVAARAGLAGPSHLGRVVHASR
jgi:site-specific recombinase XerC